MSSVRLDVAMVERGLTESRQKAQDLIKESNVTVNGKTVTKAALPVSIEDEIAITGSTLRYVSRGGLKLEGALRTFSIDVSNKLCLDIGASTGGFTDCLLQHGAACVCAMDVGHDQLHESLRHDKRVIVLEKLNIRDCSIEAIGFLPEFVCCDVSFISLETILGDIASLMSETGECVLLIKPQFEAGRQNIGKNGIVKSKKVHIAVIRRVIACCLQKGIVPLHIAVSPITGKDGNREYLLHGTKQKCIYQDLNIEAVVG